MSEFHVSSKEFIYFVLKLLRNVFRAENDTMNILLFYTLVYGVT